MQEQVRLQKYMAEAGAGSRRKCEEWIRQGLVRVNGEVVTELGTKLDPQKDVVEFRGKVLRPTQELVTVMLNKPAGYVTTSRDQFGRPDVGGLVRIPGLRLYPVGRLDYQTTGLLLMTNDGDLAFYLTHPRHHISRTYEALIKGKPDSETISRLERGVRLDDGYKTKPARVRLLESGEESSRLEVVLFEGKNHQVRRMARAVGHPVLRLRRVAMGPLRLENLPEGRYRRLTAQEVEELRRASGIVTE